MQRKVSLMSIVDGANEFNYFYDYYINNNHENFISSNMLIYESLYKYLIVLLCTLLEINTERITTIWYDKNKSKIKISDFKAKDYVVNDLIVGIVERFNSKECKINSIDHFYDYIDKLYLIKHEDNSYIEELNLDFRITFGKDHGVNEFIKILKRVGIGAEIFKKKILIENDNEIIENTEEMEIASIFNLLINERNSIIHEYKLCGEVSKSFLLKVAILSINEYFKELYSIICVANDNFNNELNICYS